jgi:recombinational DNA repair protein (RecF pathway)
MPGHLLTTDALVLAKRPPADSFQTLSVFSAEHGSMLALQRISKKASSFSLDLFDEASLSLESSNQGRTWFIKDARLVLRHAHLGRSYETLQNTSDLAQLVSRNTVPEEGRDKVYALLREAFAAFANTSRPDIVFLKSLYRFARDEGYPVREQWFPSLPQADREGLAALLNKPLAEQMADSVFVSKMRRRLEDYLKAETEILLS